MSGVRARFLKGDEIISRLKESAASLIAQKGEILEISLFGISKCGLRGVGGRKASPSILLKRLTAPLDGYFNPKPSLPLRGVGKSSR